MTAARTADPARPASRGRIDKRESILGAAFTVFAREGYAAASVDAIAAEAGVAKPTVYNHFGDKEGLFRAVVVAEAERAVVKNLAVVHRLQDTGDDIRPLLVDVGSRLVECYSDDRSWALRRLLYAEVTKFPDLFDVVRAGAADQVAEALADRLARLSLAGRLRRLDPVAAAEQFAALLTGPMEARSRMGTKALGEAEYRAVAEAAVDTFLAAFGAQRA
ncbi:TetR/AcrR family transcriptional regulator [Actinokineospora sp. PR83]|uniref:TetR/AcrR family transcriptional regulator n=1 Tax=Actinokineospora sp. PR83 TaxID=2884908 RepID=UPI0027E003A3|nr:TetR/AcrR family transcriptional regulator C-terminal domain-containing protein [Actinokineospora sp. PR83]MCG8918759.1 TetR/AcrR family transcriptional regulator [Actinokineospora sp. PR83]